MDAVVIVRFDERGKIEYHVCGNETVRLFIIDERAKSDRVYEWLSRVDGDTIKLLIGESQIGSCKDARHPAIEAVINEALGGAPRLRVVETEE